MALFDARCVLCGWQGEVQVKLNDTDALWCPQCDQPGVEKVFLKAPLGRMRGVIPKGGGPDKFTADMLGIPLKDLPPGLKV